MTRRITTWNKRYPLGPDVQVLLDYALKSPPNTMSLVFGCHLSHLSLLRIYPSSHRTCRHPLRAFLSLHSIMYRSGTSLKMEFFVRKREHNMGRKTGQSWGAMAPGARLPLVPNLSKIRDMHKHSTSSYDPKTCVALPQKIDCRRSGPLFSQSREASSRLMSS